MEKRKIRGDLLLTYQSNLKNRILPASGHLRIDQIKPLHIVNFIDSLSKD
ncbi:tyrosine-type recombinase/integrase [Paenibacillus alginolyticus]|uniref:N-terminal phage integrase SAM-like domain-containing protein n=1 Tax=Paenibacillus alginolyticus TaxID=59839 RepID=A0ABT4GI88_9BACL|nr:hypothetical protein [Paenibacillus alginolyticus]MCY9695908.1 N-terminal phage integrase SAM-like domain-containing protein [Paenibacillus alginolyticus]MEC0146759.1 hypothetical protein [Paenibacillus alginolyticus]